MNKSDTTADVSLLRPKIRALANQLLLECKKHNFNVIISRTFRTQEEQDELYAQGRTTPGNIVTLVTGGFSFHNYGVAFDVRVILSEEEQYKKEQIYRKVGEIGMALGLEWGGTWTEFLDLPHFQYTAGYSIDDFRNNRVDWNKFNE